VVDKVVKAIAAHDGATRAGLVGEDVRQDQVVLLAVLLGHTALLADRALLLVSTRVTEVADDSRARRERTVAVGETLASHGKQYTTKGGEMGKQYVYSIINRGVG
jgi:hypothetical protein